MVKISPETNPKVLITGITGMVGSYFQLMYKDRGYEVYGIARNSASSRMEAIPDRNIFRCDITDRDALGGVFDKVRPELVIHMAAQAFNGLSWECEESTHHTNYKGTLNVLKCALRNGESTKVLLACSSAEYGDFDISECPLKENRSLRPLTPYGVSKVATEMLGLQYHLNFGLPVYFPRMFIHVGTGHPPATAIQNFARQLALISKGRLEPVVRVGNLETARDFIDVRDGVEAMNLLIEKDIRGVPVNICTGKAHKIADILQMLIQIAGIKVDVIEDKTLLRVSDEPLLLGDNSLIKSYGFKQKYQMQETLENVYHDWLQRI
ncbi:MAG: GDP-mannose 4,6-dehydratase [Prevotellaceae bacterium]|jgi:GDP-4-dehydro-6-deoxy-D-mannose reductase|nr:GDP-mannose 4,6-dehydratase [Prevotellaceae bacterium]